MDFVMDLQLFGGGGETQTTSREIPDQTANEKMLEDFLLDSSSLGGNMAPYAYQAFAGSLGNTFTPNWNDLYSSTQFRRDDALPAYEKSLIGELQAYKNNMWGALNSYNEVMDAQKPLWDKLVNGELPTAYASNRQAALNADLKGTVGSAINNLASRGVINSGVGNKALDDISQSASDTLAKMYRDDLMTESTLLGNQGQYAQNRYNTNVSNAADVFGNATKTYDTWLGNRNNAADSSLGNAIQAQSASFDAPNQFLSYAGKLSTPVSNLYNTMYSGRMGTGSTTTTHDDGGAGMWSAVGGLGSAAIMCFHGNTLVTTPKGYKAIRNIQVGDEVLSVHEGEIMPKKVTAVIGPTRQTIIDVYFENGTVWHTTKGQRYFDGTHFGYVEHEGEPALVYNGNKTHILEVRESGKTAMVYDLTLEGFAGENVFFANDVAAEGFGD